LVALSPANGEQHLVDQTVQGNKRTQISRWQGNVLLADRKSKEGSYRATIRMNLSGASKTATEHIMVKSPNDINSSTLVWERK